MPSATVHLKIAYMMKNELGIKNDAEFYMGAIAPDAVNLEGYASEKVRYSAHIRSKNYDEWKSDIEAFYEENKDSFGGDEDFLKGYVFHLYTDIAWDEVVQPNLFAYLKKQGYSQEEFKEQKWKELFRLNNVLAGQPWYDEVKGSLAGAVCYEIAGVSACLMESYKKYILGDYVKDKVIDEPTGYLNDNHVFAAAIRAAGYFEGLID